MRKVYGIEYTTIGYPNLCIIFDSRVYRSKKKAYKRLERIHSELIDPCMKNHPGMITNYFMYVKFARELKSFVREEDGYLYFNEQDHERSATLKVVARYIY